MNHISFRTAFVAFLGLCFVLSASAQTPEASGEDALPSGDLLRPAPNFCKWEVTYDYPEDHAVSSGDTPFKPADSFYLHPRKVVTTKTNDIIREEIFDLKNRLTQRWIQGKRQFTKLPGDVGWGKDSAGPYNPYFKPLPPSGFRDMDWVSSQMFRNLLKRGDVTYIVFMPKEENDGNPVKDARDLSKYQNVVLVDLATRLPIIAKQNGVARTFRYLAAPADMLAFPGDLQEILQQEEADRRRLLGAP